MNSKNFLSIIACLFILTLGLSQSLVTSTVLASSPSATSSATLTDNGCGGGSVDEEEVSDETDPETPEIDDTTPDASGSADEDIHINYHKKHHYHKKHDHYYNNDNSDEGDDSEEIDAPEDPGVDEPCPASNSGSTSSTSTSSGNSSSSSPANGAVLGTSAINLAPTGEAEEHLMNSILGLGVLTLVYGFRKYGQKVSPKA